MARRGRVSFVFPFIAPCGLTGSTAIGWIALRDSMLVYDRVMTACKARGRGETMRRNLMVDRVRVYAYTTFLL